MSSVSFDHGSSFHGVFVGVVGLLGIHIDSFATMVCREEMEGTTLLGFFGGVE